MFVAVVPPEPVIEHLDAFMEVRRQAAAFRWAARDSFHVTLAFLASVDPWRLDELTERLARAAARRTAFAAAIAGGGAFPNAGRAKVLWAGLDTDPLELGRLATGARAAAAKSGIEVGGSRFRGHVTLARLGVPAEVSNWVRLLDGYRGPTWTVSSIRLIESHLGEGPRGRPRYETVADFPLGRRPG
jgi:RNA 2',3'-cyclic 3'-phosphodiesterase